MWTKHPFKDMFNFNFIIGWKSIYKREVDTKSRWYLIGIYGVMEMDNLDANVKNRNISHHS